MRAEPFLFAAALVAMAAWGGCRSQVAPPAAPPPSLRVYAISTLAGALEPCGCVKDMLGGVDHAAALVEQQSSAAARRLIVAAGPLLFQNPVVTEQARQQEIWKAEAIAGSLERMGLVAWAPGANDWAAGEQELARLASVSRAALLAGNLRGKAAGARAVKRVDINGLPVGIAGVSLPEHGGKLPPGVSADAPEAALERARQDLVRQGARLLVALVAMPRGAALRLAERATGWHLMVIGKPSDQGETNDEPTPPLRIGKTLVVQSPNHLQAVAVIDFVQRGDDFDFRDGAGIDVVGQRESLEHRIIELKGRILEWENDKTVVPSDLAARRRDLERLERELSRLKPSPPPPEGSFFRYALSEVRERSGSDARIAELLSGYYQRVNEHNRLAYADRQPPPVPAGASGYVGIEKCSSCHDEERAFWNTTAHANAYETIERQHKQFNLDCVGCHVTGYEKPGGATVTQVGDLRDVQCESCHGPGSRHVADPKNAAFIVKSPPRSLCAPACHHPPHVKEDWSADRAWSHIIGKGHGR